MLPIEKILRGKQVTVLICLALRDNDQTTGITNRPGFQQDGVNHAEHRSISTNSESQCKHRCKGKAWRHQKRSDSEMNVLQKSLHSMYPLQRETVKQVNRYADAL